MRCPKCGYISFDKVESCSKCAASLAEISENILGTAQKVEAPAFLASVIGGTGGEAAFEESQDAYAEETEFDLSDAVEEEAPDEDLMEDDIDLAGEEEIELQAEESDVPSIDLSQFDETQDDAVEEEALADVELEVDAADEPDEDGSIDFHMEEEFELEPQAEPSQEASLPEEGEEVASPGLDFELEEEGAAVELEELPDIGGEEELVLDSESELSLDEAAAESEPEPELEPEGGISLDLDVDLGDDEPAEDEMVFNLEDIDMSDLVIEDGAGQEVGPPPSEEDVALDLEDFLAEDGDNAAEAQLDDIPMDLSLEDGELLEGDSSKDQEKELQDLPEIEL